jgi:hypothetical protein
MYIEPSAHQRTCYMCVCVCMCVRVYMRVYVCVCVYIYIYIYIYIYNFVCIKEMCPGVCENVCMHACMRMSERVNVCVCVFVQAHSMQVYACMQTRRHMCVGVVLCLYTRYSDTHANLLYIYILCTYYKHENTCIHTCTNLTRKFSNAGPNICPYIHTYTNLIRKFPNAGRNICSYTLTYIHTYIHTCSGPIHHSRHLRGRNGGKTRPGGVHCYVNYSQGGPQRYASSNL